MDCDKASHVDIFEAHSKKRNQKSEGLKAVKDTAHSRDIQGSEWLDKSEPRRVNKRSC